MTRFPRLVNLLIASVSCAGVSLAAEVPSQTYSINNATLGVTTLVDIQKTYGKAEVSRIGREDESDVRVCYVYSSPKGNAFLIFESGVMGGFKEITGFRISAIRPKGFCIATKTNIAALETGSGVRLGQNLADFKKIIPVEFKRSGSKLIYESVSQRAATQDELKELRAKWPNEKQDYFDVTTTLGARFKADRLVDFYIRKIESY
jgi:hypothetical protein